MDMTRNLLILSAVSAAVMAHAQVQTPPENPAAPQMRNDSSGGYRAQTRSGSGDQSSPQSEIRSQTQSDRMPPPAPMTQLSPKTENGITYLCGGVGADEAAWMKRSARDHDLMLTFAARNGSFLADVNVELADARGKSILKTSCDGPIMLVDLPRSGTYRVRAEKGGYTVTQTAQVSAKHHGKAVVMVWPKEIADVESADQAPRGNEKSAR
jgi:hypothetical protein